MGVLSCCRHDCGSIMCDTYIPGIGYLCYGCQEEFKEYFTRQNTRPNSDSEIFRELEKFVDTSKGSIDTNKGADIEAFFKHYTKP